MNIRPNKTKRPVGSPPPSVQTPPAPSAAAPPQSTRRPKSRVWPLALAVLLGIGGWWIWDHIIRTSAYALVDVEQIHIAAPLSGMIESLSVKEDGNYEAGTTAFSVVDRETRNALETAQLRLRLVESRLTERKMALELRRDDRLYAREQTLIRHRALLAEARVEKAELAAEIARLSVDVEFKDSELSRIRHLADDEAASAQELSRAQADYDAASKRLSNLQDAQRAARGRIEAYRTAIEQPIPQAPALSAGIEPLQREMEVVRRQIEQFSEQLQHSDVRLPSPGRVTRVLRQPGEYVRVGDPILIVSKPGTLRVTAYFEQGDASRLRIGMGVRVTSSYAPTVTGRVTRVGPSLKLAPEAIARFHPDAAPLLPVEIEIDVVGLKHLVPGSVVRVYPDLGFKAVKSALAGEEEH